MISARFSWGHEIETLQISSHLQSNRTWQITGKQRNIKAFSPRAEGMPTNLDMERKANCNARLEKKARGKGNRGELFMVSSSGNFRVFLSGPRAIHSGRVGPLSMCKTICPISQRMDGHFPGAKYICFRQPAFGTTTFLTFMSSIFWENGTLGSCQKSR